MIVHTEQPTEHIALLRLADGAKRNALSPALIEDFLSALDGALASGARAVIVAGDKRFFCAGADINGLRDNHWLDAEPTGISPYDLFKALERCPSVVIAAVEGLALGGGFELTLCCDLAVAGSEASFAFPEVGLGVMPNAGLARLAEICGVRRAAEIILTRRRISAHEAFALGIVNACVPSATTETAAIGFARQIVTGAPPAAIAAAKHVLRSLNGADWPAIQGKISKLDPAEWREGLESFLEKRPAHFERFWQERTGDSPRHDSR